MGTLTIDVRPAGPVAAAFRVAEPRGAVIGGRRVGAGIKVLNGPIGSAKTTENFIAHLFHAMQQPRSVEDGLRRYRMTAVKDTYPTLWKNLLDKWFRLFPRDFGEFVGATDRPATHKIVLPMEDGGHVEFTADFLAMGDLSASDAMKGYEPTSMFLNELDLLCSVSLDAMLEAAGRCGRHPHSSHGQPGWYGVTADFNKTDVDHILYGFLVEDRPDGVVMFEQPSGLSPDAENTWRLPDGYYRSIEALNKHRPDYVRRNVYNQWGASRSGDPCYPEYDDMAHCSRETLAADHQWPLVLGGDAGRHPAVIAVQYDWLNGRWVVLRELYEENVGALTFAKTLNRWLAHHFPGWQPGRIVGWGDPASANLTESAEMSWMQIVTQHTGILFRPAPGGNNVTLRLSAVSTALRDKAEDGGPALVMDPSCKMLRKGFNSHYFFKKRRVGGAEIFTDAKKPHKNEFSNPHDALQNALLGAGGAHDVFERKESRRAGFKQVVAASDFSVF